jgi:hypothetical protein
MAPPIAAADIPMITIIGNAIPGLS